MSVVTAKRIIVGVSAGIAAYKACIVIRAFRALGHDVYVIPTPAALHFVGAATFEALSGHPVYTDVFDHISSVAHVRLGQDADLIVIVPATADLLARAAAGQADDLLTATLLMAHCPVIFVPAMHTEMWNHPATQDNVHRLRSRQIKVLYPAYGRLTGTDTGFGRLLEPDDIVAIATLLLDDPNALPYDLTGKKILVTAGGTHEAIDPVRFIGNHSSGKQGYALARVAAQRGAHVTLISAHTKGISVPGGVDALSVSSAQQLYDMVIAHLENIDILLMAAAVADFRPDHHAPHKLKKDPHHPHQVPILSLVRNPDILATITAARRAGQLPHLSVIVGFAAETGDETGDVLFHAREKFTNKGCDLLFVNTVGHGKVFDLDHSSGWLFTSDGHEIILESGSKTLIASKILDSVAEHLTSTIA